MSGAVDLALLPDGVYDAENVRRWGGVSINCQMAGPY